LLLFFINLGNFVDITKEAKKVNLIVCLGGNNQDRIPKSLELLNRKFSENKQILYMGTKTKFLEKYKESITFTKSFSNTMDEIKYLDKTINTKIDKSIIIVTDPTHSRRVDFLIQNFSLNLKKLDYIIVSTEAKWWNKYFYFIGAKSFVHTILEINKIVYNYVKYKFLEESSIVKKLDSYASIIKIEVSKRFKY